MATRELNQNFKKLGAGRMPIAYPCCHKPAPMLPFGGTMNTEELLEILNEDAIKKGKHGSSYEPEWEPEDVDEKIVDAGGPETDEEREASND